MYIIELLFVNFFFLPRRVELILFSGTMKRVVGSETTLAWPAYLCSLVVMGKRLGLGLLLSSWVRSREWLHCKGWGGDVGSALRRLGLRRCAWWGGHCSLFPGRAHCEVPRISVGVHACHLTPVLPFTGSPLWASRWLERKQVMARLSCHRPFLRYCHQNHCPVPTDLFCPARPRLGSHRSLEICSAGVKTFLLRLKLATASEKDHIFKGRKSI